MKAMIAIAATLLIGFANAASDWANQTAVQVDDQTVTFVNKAAQGGMGEVALGRWALTRSDDAQVKMFSQHLIDDHSKANAELRQLAERLGISMPEPLTQQQQELQARLTNLQGADFKREFFHGAVLDHREDIADFNDYVKNGKNEDVRAFAQRQLPALQDHLRMAEDFERGVASNAPAVQAPVAAAYSTTERVTGRRWSGDETVVSSNGCGSCNSCKSHKSCHSCSSCGSYNHCDRCLSDYVYDNDWRAGEVDFVTGEDQCSECGSGFAWY